jgi:hypothetical protein
MLAKAKVRDPFADSIAKASLYSISNQGDFTNRLN